MQSLNSSYLATARTLYIYKLYQNIIYYILLSALENIVHSNLKVTNKSQETIAFWLSKSAKVKTSHYLLYPSFD